MGTTQPVNYRSPSGRYVRWPLLIERARRQPGVWFLALTDAPASTVISVTKRRAPALRSIIGGVLRAELRAEYTDPAGTQRGDVYLRFDSHEEN